MTTIVRLFTAAICAATFLSCGREQGSAEEESMKKWYKGNLHTHSYWSDGDEFPEMIMSWYKSHDYDFIALSDHNTLAEGEKWVKVPKSRIFEEAFENYRTKFGDDWITYRVDSGRTVVKLKTLEEYRPKFEDDSFMIIQSEELTDAFDGHPIHVNATNIQSVIPPQGGTSVANVLQRNIDAVLRQREETGVPMFPHINHPNFYYGVSLQDMIDLRGERFFEVYNGHPLVNNYGDSLHPGTENMWDLINIAYHNRNQPLMFGLATDDSHNYHLFGSEYSNAGRGWVMVHTDSLAPSAIVRAMEAGDFYATTGVLLDELSFTDNVLSVKVRPQVDVAYEIQLIGVNTSTQESAVIRSVRGTEVQFEVTDDFMFVRAKILSDRPKPNPFQEGDMEVAWTQPVTFQPQ